MSDEDLSDLWPLYDIAQQLGDVSPRQLMLWSSKRHQTGFPMPVRKVGRYYMYSLKEVTEWYTLWRRATKRMGRSNLVTRAAANDDSGIDPDLH